MQYYKSTYRNGSVFTNSKREVIHEHYLKLGDNAEREQDYAGKHDYWQHAEY